VVLEKILTKYALLTVLTFAVLAVIFGYIGLKSFSVNSDLASLAPESATFYEDQIDFLAEKLSSNLLTVVGYSNGDIRNVKMAFTSLKERFESTPYILETMKLDNPELFVKYGFLATDKEMLDDLISMFNINGSNVMDFAMWRKIMNSAAFAESMVKEYLKRSGIEQYIMVSPDERLAVINFTLKDNLTDVAKVTESVSKLKDIVSEVANETGVKMLLTGTAAGTYESNQQVTKDFITTTVISFVGICFVIFLFYGNLIVLALLLVSMVVAMSITLGLSTFFLGEINIVTSFANAMILGLGIDYGIHVITRIADKRATEGVNRAPVHIAVKEVLRPCLSASVTTLGAFSSMVLSMSRAFTQMGLFAMTGIGVFFITMILFLPALVTVTKPKIGKNFSKIRFEFLFSKKMGRILRTVVIVSVPVLVVFGSLNLMNFWYTPSGLVSDTAESAIAFNDVKKSFQRIGVGEVVVMADSLDELRILQDKIKSTDFLTSPLSVLSILDYTGKTDLDDIPQVYSSLAEIVRNPILSALFRRVGLHSQLIEMLRVAAKAKDFSDVVQELKKDVPLFFYDTATSTKFLMYTDSVEDLYKNNRIKNIFDFFNRNQIKTYGYPTLLYYVMRDMRNTIYWLAGVVMLMVFLVVLIDSRSFKQALIIFLTVFTSIFWTFGIGYILGIHATFMTLLLLPILVGIGVDGIIHLRHSALHGDKSILLRTAKSVTISTLTTIIAFGSFSFAKGQLLREFGVLMGIGLFACWLLSLFVTNVFFKRGDIIENSDVH